MGCNSNGLFAWYFVTPLHRVHRTHQEVEASCPIECDGGEDQECPEEVSRAAYDIPGDGWRNNAGEIPESILKAHPAPGSLRTSETLRDRKDIGGTSAEAGHRAVYKHNAESRADERA